MSNNVVVCFMMPNLTFSAEEPWEIVARANLYASKLKALNCESASAYLLTSGLGGPSPEEIERLKNLKLANFSNLHLNAFRFLRKSFSFLKLLKADKMTLIAGDNNSALLICLILKSLMRDKIRIQVSIHGNPLIGNQSLLKKILRMCAFKIMFRNVDSFRLVSPHLQSELGAYFGKKSVVCIAPIPIVIPSNLAVSNKSAVIGIVGRLHPERGIDMLLAIASQIMASDSKVRLQFVGDGPARDEIQELTDSDSKRRILFLGKISHRSVLEKYSEMSLLLSCAPSEGYGLALREAIMRGVPVVARRNTGTTTLQKQFPQMIFLFDAAEEAIQIINEKIDFIPSSELILSYQNQQLNQDSESLINLAKSWIY